MLISEDDNSDLEVDFIALVDKPAIKRNFEAFLEPNKGEHEKDFIPRCIAYVVGEGKDTEQATAICYSMWEQHFAAEKVSFDWDETLSTDRGEELLKRRISEGATCYIISARGEVTDSMLAMADKYGIPHSRVYATGSNKAKEEKIAALGISKHYDNNEDVIADLPGVGIQFADTYNDYPETAVNNAKRALKWADEHGWGTCGEATGKVRANQIANKENLSRDTIARISGFRRHQQNKDVPYSEGCGGLMWDAWGGDAMIDWAERKLKQIDRQGFQIQSEEQRIITGPLMVAGMKIYRNDPQNGEYYVQFSKDTIKKIAIKMARKGYQNNVNIMHDPKQKVDGVTLFEVFQTDAERGIKPPKGYEDLPDGSLFGSMYVQNDNVWEAVKDGKIKGFSVEGNFGFKAKDKYEALLSEIISVLSETEE